MRDGRPLPPSPHPLVNTPLAYHDVDRPVQYKGKKSNSPLPASLPVPSSLPAASLMPLWNVLYVKPPVNNTYGRKSTLSSLRVLH